MADDLPTPLPGEPLASGQPVSAREFFAGVILNAIMIQNRMNTPDEAMQAAWDFADQFQYIGHWGRAKETNDGKA